MPEQWQPAPASHQAAREAQAVEASGYVRACELPARGARFPPRRPPLHSTHPLPPPAAPRAVAAAARPACDPSRLSARPARGRSRLVRGVSSKLVVGMSTFLHATERCRKGGKAAAYSAPGVPLLRRRRPASPLLLPLGPLAAASSRTSPLQRSLRPWPPPGRAAPRRPWLLQLRSHRFRSVLVVFGLARRHLI